jgi:hydroxypyruvate reductase
VNKEMIKNTSTLLRHSEFLDSIKILNEGINAADPESCLKPFFSKNRIKIKRSIINLKQYDNVYIIAIGKASDLMAKFVSKKVDFTRGLVVMPSSYKPVFSNKKIRFFKSGHPLPNKQSVSAAIYLEKFISKTKKNDFIIFLISGGGSALISHPMKISLEEKITVNDQLIRSGANINEISCVRKHLSEIKGGKLLEQMNCTGISLVMSDVIGDDLSSISSGLTFSDTTTFSQALRILKKYEIHNKISQNVINILEMGVQKKFPETPKKPMIKNIIIGNNYKCLLAMRDKSKHLNYDVSLISDLNTDVKIAAKKIVKKFMTTKNTCLVFGGETTVNVTGTGKGGRNQELVLQLLKKLKKYNNFIISSIATDGIDGNTQFAGAIVSSKRILPFETYLKNNDSFSFYKKYGGLIKTGPTHTNMNDVGIIIRQNL